MTDAHLTDPDQTSELHQLPALDPSGVDRRTVLRTGALVGAAGTVATATTGLLAGTAGAAAAALPSRAALAGLAGKTFTTSVAGRIVRVRLTKVADAPYRPTGLSRTRLAAWRRASFTLHLTSAVDLPQGTYRLRHPSTGAFRLLLVPGPRAAGRTPLTADINRWKG